MNFSKPITFPNFRDSRGRLVHTAPQSNWVTARDESREMMAVWPDVVRDLTDAGCHLDIPDVTKWIAKVIS